MSLINGFEDLGPESGGSSMGDYQVGDDHTRRYRRRLSDGTWLLITETFCAEDTCAAYHDALPDEPCPAGCSPDYRYGWAEQDEILIASDPDGANEIYCDYTYEQGSYYGCALSTEADRLAREQSQQDNRSAWADSDDPNVWTAS